MNKIDEKQAEEIFKKGIVHFVLSHSYMVFLFAVILGVIFDLIFSMKFSFGNQSQYLGVIIIVLSSALIYWAQSSSSNYQSKLKNRGNRSYFEIGPYRYSRHPTHLGLFMLTIGFSLIISSLFSAIFAVLAYAISILFFLRKEERVLEERYGKEYQDYKKKTKNWI